jgi:hypothetical protein
MFNENYIMTGIVLMLLSAAWQKPALYKDHLCSKVMFLSMSAIFLFISWDMSLDVAISNFPEALKDELREEVEKSIKKYSVPFTWWAFVVSMYFANFLIDWIASVSLKYEKKI